MLEKLTKVGLAIACFIIIYYILPNAFSNIRFIRDFAAEFPLLYQLITWTVFSLLFMRILPQKLSDFGLISVGFNYLKILLVTLCIQAIPFTLFLILLFAESLLLSQWMLLSLQQLFLIYVLLSPLAEELFFRGLIQTILSPLQILNLKILDFSLTAPVVITSVLFAVAHFAYSLQALVFIIALSIFCGYLRERSQSVIPGIFAHAIFNIFSVFIPKVIMLVLEKYA